VKPASNNQIKLLRKLGSKKYREKEGLFIVEGERAVQQVIENKILKVIDAFIDEKSGENYSFLGDEFFCIDSSTFKEVSDTENPQGVLAVCSIPNQIEIKKLNDQEGLIIATDGIQDPGNLGTIVRTASWFGASAILLGKGTVDMFHPKVVRSTAGATGVLPYRNSILKNDLIELEANGWQILLLDGNKGAEEIGKIKPHKKTILVVGNEANGISGDLISTERKRVLIPSVEKNRSVESLNAAIAVSIALYQLNS
jgi:TrmH family RNA methyltransferase